MDVTFAGLEGSVLSIEDSFLEVSTTTFDDQHNHEHQLKTSTPRKMNEPNDEPAPVQAGVPMNLSLMCWSLPKRYHDHTFHKGVFHSKP